jgi:hypothetical protein
MGKALKAPMAADPTPMTADMRSWSSATRAKLSTIATGLAFLSAAIGVLLSAFIGACAVTRASSGARKEHELC